MTVDPHGSFFNLDLLWLLLFILILSSHHILTSNVPPYKSEAQCTLGWSNSSASINHFSDTPPCGSRRAWRWRTHPRCPRSSRLRSWCRTLCCCPSWSPEHQYLVRSRFKEFSPPRHQSGPGAWMARAWCRAWCRCWRRCRWWWARGPGHWGAPSTGRTTSTPHGRKGTHLLLTCCPHQLWWWDPQEEPGPPETLWSLQLLINYRIPGWLSRVKPNVKMLYFYFKA